MDEKHRNELEWRILEVEHALMQWRHAIKSEEVEPKSDESQFSAPIRMHGSLLFEIETLFL